MATKKRPLSGGNERIGVRTRRMAKVLTADVEAGGADEAKDVSSVQDKEPKEVDLLG